MIPSKEDALLLNTDDEILGENLKTNIRRSARDSKNRTDTVPYHILEILGLEMK